MRAVARGLFLETLPACPEECGGPHACLDLLPEAKRRHRTRHGCDKPIPEGQRSHYAIRCPRCDGAAAYGTECGLCGDENPGFVHMRRCPASQASPDVLAALDSMTWLAQHHILPAEGGLGEQTISFVDFRAVYEREKAETIREQQKEG